MPWFAEDLSAHIGEKQLNAIVLAYLEEHAQAMLPSPTQQSAPSNSQPDSDSADEPFELSRRIFERKPREPRHEETQGGAASNPSQRRRFVLLAVDESLDDAFSLPVLVQLWYGRALRALPSASSSMNHACSSDDDDPCCAGQRTRSSSRWCC